MPIKVQNDLPAKKIMEKENIFIITRKELKEKIINNIGDVILSDNIIVEKETRGTAYAVAIGIEKVSKKIRMLLFLFFRRMLI